jgi:hypothetical protein
MFRIPYIARSHNTSGHNGGAMLYKLSEQQKSDLKLSFLKRYRGFAWSNPNASPDIIERIIINRMLLSPSFDQLLDASYTIGLERMEEAWDKLLRSNDADTKKALSRTEDLTSRYLRNIRHGYEQAAR